MMRIILLFLTCISITVAKELLVLEPNQSEIYILNPNSTYKFEMIVQGDDNYVGLDIISINTNVSGKFQTYKTIIITDNDEGKITFTNKFIMTTIIIDVDIYRDNLFSLTYLFVLDNLLFVSISVLIFAIIIIGLCFCIVHRDRKIRNQIIKDYENGMIEMTDIENK